MPRTRSLAWSELKVGVVTIAAIGIAALTIFLLTGERGFFWQRYNLKVRFGNVAGLNPGSSVRLAGVVVGSVDEISLVDDQVDVVVQINRAFGRRITTNSVARLGSVSLLGESAVDITPSSTGTPIPEWGYVPAGRTPAQLSDMTDQASRGLDELTSLLHDVRTGRGTIGKFMTDEQLYADLHRFVGSATDLTEGLKRGNGTIGRLLRDPKAADALERSLKNVEEVTRRINAGEGSLGKLLQDERFLRSLAAARSSFETLAGKLNRSEGTAGKLINDPALFERLNSVTQRLDQLVTRLNDGEGTAGRLLKDRQLYENMNGAVADLRSLITDIRKDPKKFLTVRISIF